MELGRLKKLHANFLKNQPSCCHGQHGRASNGYHKPQTARRHTAIILCHESWMTINHT